MFAMLTGTLPFTVEPFNIKQLHLKMINGEMNPLPPDVSTGNLFPILYTYSIFLSGRGVSFRQS